MNVVRAAVIAASLALLMPGTGEAAAIACAPGTLSDYFALSEGCTVGALQFQNFGQLTTQPAGSSPILTDAVQVTPLTSGLAFAADVTAGTGDLFEILFGYDVTAPAIAGASLSLGGATAGGDGVVTAVKSFCEGSRFSPGDLTGCHGASSGLIAVALDGLDDLDHFLAFLPNVALLAVVDDIAVDGGLEGNASLHGSVTNQFVAASPVPEPASAILVASGLVGLLRSRSRRVGIRRS